MNFPHLPYPFHMEQFVFGPHAIALCLPQPSAVYQVFVNNDTKAAPYWSRLWPSALGLCTYLAANPAVVAGKQVVELAAGLGLPSLLAAQWANSVLSTDCEGEAIQFIAASASANQLTNLDTGILDWAQLDTIHNPDVILLSDINYDPAAFHILQQQLQQALAKGATLLLSTPQRLMAKPFIESLLPWCTRQETVEVVYEGKETAICIYVLQAIIKK